MSRRLGRPWDGVDIMRQYRGLVRHVHAEHIAASRTRRGIPCFGPIRRYDGVCRWCGRPTPKRRAWHKGCLVAYWAATGNSSQLRYAMGPAPLCPCGQPGTELDHRDALCLASLSSDLGRYRRALSLANLQWLCRTCHLQKTRSDRRALSRNEDILAYGVAQMPLFAED